MSLEQDVMVLEGQLRSAHRRLANLESFVRELRRAAVAHAGDTEAHPNSHNDALRILRALEEGGTDG